MRQILLFFSFWALMGLPSAQAKLFQNNYISFEIPETWECKAFGTDWVCHSQFQEKKVEALITSTAKIAGPNDTLDEYLNYLKSSKSWHNVKKEHITSKLISPARRVFINRFHWVDAIHRNSEVKSYISRYAGTVCCENNSSQLGILVVLSAHQDYYQKYSGDFVKAVNSLKVMDIDKAVEAVKAAQDSGEGEAMSSYLEGLFDEGMGGPQDGEGYSGMKIFGVDPIYIGIGGFAGVLALLWSLSKKTGRKRKRRRSRR